jgi:hypothetical protein
MENIRIIKLNPNTYISNVSTFDEAFDEYSEASGKRRAKRQARKLEKERGKAEIQRAKADTKVARVGKRTARKVAKQESRDTTASMRQARRRQRIDEAQARKTGRAEAIQSRRTGRKTARLDRRALGEELEPELEPELEDEQIDDTIDDGGYYEEEQEYVPQGGGVYEDDRVDDSTYEEDGSGNNFEQGFEENFGNDEDFSEEEPEYGDEYNSYQNDEEDPFGSGFDGTIKNDDEFSDIEQASKVIEIPDAITVVADKIEWNKELYSRLDGKKKEILNQNASANIDELDSQLRDRGDRIVDLESLLDGWANCKYNYDANNQFQEFPLMDIDYSNADGKNKFARMKRNRFKQVSKAKELAKKKREKVTKVKTSLNPIIAKGKIVVPSANPSSGFDGIPQGTGLNGLDNSNDYDAPPQLTFDLTSNASGPESKTNINGILLGVGIALVGIWAIRKYKLIK